MKLSSEHRKIQRSILGFLKKNIPLAGLLAGAAVIAGCHPKPQKPSAVMGKMTLDGKGSNKAEEVKEDELSGYVEQTMGELPDESADGTDGEDSTASESSDP